MPERDIGAEEEEEGQGWGDSRRLMQILYARAYTNDPRSYIVVFSAPLPPNVEQHLSGEQQHDHLPHPDRHHLTAMYCQTTKKGDHSPQTLN